MKPYTGRWPPVTSDDFTGGQYLTHLKMKTPIDLQGGMISHNVIQIFHSRVSFSNAMAYGVISLNTIIS